MRYYTGEINGLSASGDINTSYWFDANGNLMTLNRGAFCAEKEMDRLGYEYAEFLECIPIIIQILSRIKT